jgi:acetylornithine deacetylase/succinyl-diaminopimelate desuccinylase-like protein
MLEDTGRYADLLSQYIKIDTTNPPGDTRKSAEFLKKIIEGEGIECKLFASAEDKINLMARIKGKAGAKPVILLHHMDVVPADRRKWSFDPFSGEIKDGYIIGRGALDDKGLGIMHLIAFLRAKENPPKRDIIFLAVSDEETGGRYGTKWLLENVLELKDAEFVLDEGGFGTSSLVENTPVFLISVWEKKALWLKVVASGRGGHGSCPHEDQAVVKLNYAINRMLNMKTGIRLNEATRAMFDGLAGKDTKFLALRHITNPIVKFLVARRAISRPFINALLRDTVCLTKVEAGFKENIIPSIASATFDIRLLPDTNSEFFLRRIRQRLAGKDIDIETVLMPDDTPMSRFDSFPFNIFEHVIRKEVGEKAIVVPYQTIGITDSRYFRKAGVLSYGLLPVLANQDEIARIHGVDERISIDNLALGVKITQSILERV